MRNYGFQNAGASRAHVLSLAGYQWVFVALIYLVVAARERTMTMPKNETLKQQVFPPIYTLHRCA